MSLHPQFTTLSQRVCLSFPFEEPRSSAVLAQVVHHELSVPDVTQLLLSVACWATARATGALLADLPGVPSRESLEPFWGVGALVAIAVVRANPASAISVLVAFDGQLSWLGDTLCMPNTLINITVRHGQCAMACPLWPSLRY